MPYQSVASPRLVLALLTAVVLINIVDRQLIGILAEPIKAELGLSDTQLGLLTGLAFSLFYAFMSLPIARLADRGDRVRIISVATAAWSAMTAVCGLAPNFHILLLARMGVAAGEAGCLPPTYSLIAEYFPPDKRASALAVLQIGTGLAVFCAFFIGGILGESLGWRTTFVLLSLPGLLLALSVWRVLPEPRRSSAVATQAAVAPLPLRTALALLFSQRAYIHLLIGGAAASFTVYSLLVWTPSLFQRAYAWSLSGIGMALGIVFAIGSTIGALVSGAFADKRLKRDRGAHGQVPSVLMLCAIPLVLTGLLVPNGIVALVTIALAQLLSNTWQPNVLAAVQGLADARSRALASAIVGLATNLVGLGLGPLIIGMLSDALAPHFGSQTLRYAMLPCALAYALAAFHLHLAARHLRARPET